MKKVTQATKTAEIVRNWHLIDVEGKVLGRESTEIAKILIGKSKPYFTRNLDCGDYVVVLNASKVKLTGKKETDKIYTRYSGYPGGLRKTMVKEMRVKKPEEIVRHAVNGMLPKNKLRASMLKRLYVFAGSEHRYGEHFKEASSV